MFMRSAAVVAVIACSLHTPGLGAERAEHRGVVLEDLTWVQAEKVLNPDTVVVIPLGAAAKEHGPHLRLDNDWRMAQYLAGRVVAASEIVLAPAIPYHYFPAFLEYPGSTSLSHDTARDMVVEIVRSLAHYGPRRFYVLNTGISTLGPLKDSASVLEKDGILLRYTDLEAVSGDAIKRVEKQARGTHADEIETSMMLYIAAERVDMSRAVRDDNPDAPGGLTRTPNGAGVYSPTGAWGDPTLATREKGRVVVEATISGILKDIERLRAAGRGESASDEPRH
jgi:creatinine amidohydrolase